MTDNPPQPIATTSEAGAGATGAVMAATVLGFCVVALIHAQTTDSARGPMVLAGVSGALGVLVLRGAATAVSQRRWGLLVGLAIAGLTTGMLGEFAATTLGRARCCAAVMRPLVAMKQFHTAAYSALQDGRSLPESYTVWLAASNIDAESLAADMCFQRSLLNAQVGPWTIRDFREGRLTIEELQAAASVSQPGDWEFVGHFLLSREKDALTTLDGRVIVGTEVQRSRADDTCWMMVFADNTAQLVADSELAEAVRRDRDARNERGLTPTPKVGPIAIGMARLRELEAATPE